MANDDKRGPASGPGRSPFDPRDTRRPITEQKGWGDSVDGRHAGVNRPPVSTDKTKPKEG